MHEIEASINIAASSSLVWAVVAHLEEYRLWNPFITAAQGKVAVGQPIKVTMQLARLPALDLSATIVRAEIETELAWRSALLADGMFDRVHAVTLEPNATGCRLRQVQRYDGVLAGPMAFVTRRAVVRGLAAMNVALKRRAEAAEPA